MLPLISESFPDLLYACWSVTFRKEHALGLSQQSMKNLMKRIFVIMVLPCIVRMMK
jgi:hypothetical protein